MNFLARMRRSDSAVSPVIAVILMVAITVVLAATVYVWVSGFGAQSSSPAKTMSLTSNGAITMGDYADADVASDDAMKRYTVTAAVSGMKYSDITVTVNGATLAAITDGDCTPNADTATASADRWFVCAGATNKDPATAVISAGDTFTIIVDETTLSGQTLRVLDTQANSVILTLTIG